MTLASSRKLGRYELLRSLGRGSQGSVFLARDPTLDRFVAVKVLTDPDDGFSAIAANGTPLEGLITSKLKHPNIVAIHDADYCDEGPYLVFEYVEGEMLAKRLETSGAFSIEEAVPLISQILSALAAAHAAGILHLDLGPKNILIDRDGQPRILDFGLSQFLNALRDSGDFVTGTLRYMSPEHLLGQQLGPWTDVFALGSTFYECVTDRHAMQGESIPAVQHQIIKASVDFGYLNSFEHGEAFARFLAGALHVDRQGRYADGAAMKEAFDLFLTEEGLIVSSDTGGSSHSTVDFLLRRMQRKSDFPAISRTLSDINRMTGDDSVACAEKLANVVLRDLALTSKLLKLVNSAFYGARAAEVTSISQAVVFLGAEQVRMAANSLSLFGHLKGGAPLLKDSMTRSFLSGLIARHLAQRDELERAEEAFICAMCQNLGENLVIYYFAEEFEEITRLRLEEELDNAAASRGVLGVSYAELGAAVAASWNLPDSIIQTIKGMPPGPVTAPDGEVERLRDYSVLANELCGLFHTANTDEITEGLTALLERFEPSVSVDLDYAFKMFDAAYEKLKQYSQVFEINVGASDFCRFVARWLDEQRPDVDADTNADAESCPG